LGMGVGESSKRSQVAGSSILTIIAPHVHVIQTRSCSTAVSNSPQYSWSRMKAWRAGPRLILDVTR
jgi:hypothetical protein